MINQRILFIAPSYMDLYKDIIKEMERQNYVVDFIEEKSFKDDPLNNRGNKRFGKIWVNTSDFEKKIDSYWRSVLNEDRYSYAYDILFVLDGQSLRSVVFEILKQRNPKIKTVNYLFDSTGIYHFEQNFDNFNHVFTFDPADADKYKLTLLPIYYVDESPCDHFHYHIFGMGAIKEDRYRVFKEIVDIAKKNNLTYFLRLYVFFDIKNRSLYRLRCKIYNLLGLDSISLEAIDSEFATKQTISPQEFRTYTYNSDVIIDTSAVHQKGLTARFMWALGANKKIVTTNRAVMDNSFYDKNQIYVMGEDRTLENFIKGAYEPNKENLEIINRFRIDNWVRQILTFE